MSPEVFDLIPVLVMQADSMPNLETRTHLGHPNDIDRCRWCARTDKRDHLEPVGLCPHHFTPPQTGSTTQKLFAKTWDKEQREQRIPLTVNDKRVQSRAHIKVLGRLQRGDGDDEMDILARIGRARNTVQQLHNVWDSPRLTPHQKHRLYFSLAATIVIYGCEMWDITPDIAKTINRFNTRTLERVNQRAYGTQAHKPIEWDLLGYIHYRRLIFAGHLFRAEPSPTGPTPTDTPHTSFRLLLTHVKQAPMSLLTRNEDTPPYVPITSAAGGANPHSVDFPINAGATYTKGTITEFLPRAATFAQLMAQMRPSGPRDKQAKKWLEQVHSILLPKFPHYAIPKTRAPPNQ
jgi:hypothetical protein